MKFFVMAMGLSAGIHMLVTFMEEQNKKYPTTFSKRMYNIGIFLMISLIFTTCLDFYRAMCFILGV